MRILHTADWHLGRTLEGHSRIDEQAQTIDELCDLVRDEGIQLVVVAGDVFDTANPPTAAEELFYEAVSRLSAGGERVVLVLAGNHDSPDRLCASSPLAARHGVVLLGKPGETPTLSSTLPCAVDAGPGWCELAFASGPAGSEERIVVAAVPYPSESRLDEALTDNIDSEELSRSAYSARVAQVFAAAAVAFRPDTIRLAVSHLYAAGGVESDSERPIQVGGAYTVAPAAFPATAQYVALGHLHRPQMVSGHTAIRYSGSPLAYSFSEAGQAKSVTIVEATPEQASWREVYLRAGRPLVRWRATGGLAQLERWLEEGRDATAWVDLELHLEVPLTPEEVGHIRRQHPGIVAIRPVFAAREVAAAAEGGSRQEMPVSELFSAFYAQKRGGAEPHPDTVRLFMELLQEVQGGEGSDSE